MKIETGIPAPAQKSKGRPPKYDFAALPVDNTTCMTISDAPYHSVYACVQRHKEVNPGTEFRVEQYGPKGARVWRLK